MNGFTRQTPRRRPARPAVFLLGLLTLVAGMAGVVAAYALDADAEQVVETPVVDSVPTTTTELDEPSDGEPEPAAEGAFEVCSDCHANFDAFLRRSDVLVKGFTHELHLQSGAECTSCHQQPTHTTEGIRRPTMSACFDCHQQGVEQAPPGECEACHPASFPLVPQTHAAEDWLPTRDRLDSVEAVHAGSAMEGDGECEICHSEDFCTSCHGVEMPHPSGWQQVHGETAREAEAQGSCATCHPDRRACTECHHPTWDPEGAAWRLQHPRTVAQQGVTPCFECHSSATCARCHTTGEYEEL